MVEFQTISFTNFGSYGDRAFEYDFRAAHITAFTGPNGSGKSTLLDALSFVLYGKAWRPVTKSELLNKKNKRAALVTLHFSTPKGVFKVVRGIKPDIFEIWKDGVLQNQDSRARDYQKTLETDVLKLNWEAFNQVVVVGKATYVPFMKLKTEARRSFVESVLSLQVFAAMKELRRLQASEADKRLLTAQASLTSTAPRAEMAERNIAAYKAMLDSADTVPMAKAKEWLEGLRTEYTGLVREERELGNERDNIISNLRGIWKKAHDAQHALVEAKAEEARKHQHRVSTVLDPDIAAVQDFINDCHRIVARHRRSIQSLDVSASCPTCGGPIDASAARARIAVSESEIAETEGLAAAAAPDLAMAVEAKTAYNAIVLQALSELEIERGKLAVVVSQDPALGLAVLPELAEVSERLRLKAAELAATQIDLQEATSQYAAARKREVELVSLLATAERDLAEAQSSIATFHTIATDALRDTQVLQVAASILKDTGAKATIIRRYLPVINQIVNTLLADMGMFVHFELNEEFDDKILIRGFEEMTYGGLSEGEKIRIDMAVMMAWRELCILTGASATNLLIFDEILDGSFDEQGIEAFMQSIAEKDDLNVVCMTHHVDRIDHFVDRQLQFERVEAYSSFTVAGR